MSYADEHAEPPVPKTRGLAFSCQRCGAIHVEPADDPEVAVRRAVEAGQFHTFHRCKTDGGLGICRLVGEHRGFANVAEAMRAGRAVSR